MPTTDIPTPIDTAGQTPEGLPAKSGSSRLCECGQPGCGRFMHVQVHGLFEWLCSDCLEEANLMETIYAEPCYACCGNGSIMGEDCEDCEGSGRAAW